MMSPFQNMLAFLERLKHANIYHELANYREDAVSVVVRVPGQYWEIDFLDDGTIDIERFLSNGHLDNESVLDDLIAEFSDSDADESAPSEELTAGHATPGD